MATGTPDWVFYAAAALLALAGFALALRFAWGDRARGRLRCPRCWYDMRGVASLRCPECGRTARSESRLKRTRRRLWMAPAALALLLAGAAAGIAPRAQRDGWLWPVPTTVMVWTLPWSGERGLTELLERFDGSRGMPVTRAEYDNLVRSAAVGVPGARPVSERWAASFGRLLALRTAAWPGPSSDSDSEFASAPPLSDETRRVLDALPPAPTLHLRESWPAGVPVHVRATADYWWANADEEMVNVEGRVVFPSGVAVVRGWKVGSATTGVEDEGWFEGSADIALPPGTESIEFEVRVRRGEERRIVLTKRVRRSIRLVESPEAAQPPERSEELDDALARALQISVRDSGIIAPRVLPQPGAAAAPDVAFAGRGEVLDGDEVLASFIIHWTGLPARSWIEARWEPHIGRPGSPELRALTDRLAAADPAALRVRLTADPVLALQEFDAPRAWRGTVTLPLTVRREPDLAPRSPWLGPGRGRPLLNPPS